MHLHVVGAAVQEFVKHVLEDLLLGSCQVDLSILLLDAKDSGLKLNLLNK